MFLFLQGWANHSGGDWAGMSKSGGPMDQYISYTFDYGKVIQLSSGCAVDVIMLYTIPNTCQVTIRSSCLVY